MKYSTFLVRIHLIVLLSLVTKSAIAQNDGIGMGVTDPHESSVLHIQPTGNNKGLLIPRLTSAERLNIANPAIGLMVYDITSKSLYHYDGGVWHQVGSPAGSITMWSGTTIPSGWALCNGDWYNPDDNTDHGGTNTGARTTLTPNLSGRFIVGYQSGDTDYDQPGNMSTGGSTQGKTGGLEAVTLNTTQIPSHSHTMNTGGAHDHSTSTGSDTHSHGSTWSNGSPMEDTGSNEPDRDGGGSAAKKGDPSELTIGSDTHNHTINITNSGAHPHTINNTGGGNNHENRPPYYVLAFIMKL